ncbi:hypothetical protein [Rhizobium binxianense]
MTCVNADTESLPSSALQTTVWHPPQQAEAIVYAAFLLKAEIGRNGKTLAKFFASIRKTAFSTKRDGEHSRRNVLFLPQSPGFQQVGLFISGDGLQQ